MQLDQTNRPLTCMGGGIFQLIKRLRQQDELKAERLEERFSLVIEELEVNDVKDWQQVEWLHDELLATLGENESHP